MNNNWVLLASTLCTLHWLSQLLFSLFSMICLVRKKVSYYLNVAFLIVWHFGLECRIMEVFQENGLFWCKISFCIHNEDTHVWKLYGYWCWLVIHITLLQWLFIQISTWMNFCTPCQIHWFNHAFNTSLPSHHSRLNTSCKIYLCSWVQPWSSGQKNAPIYLKP